MMAFTLTDDELIERVIVRNPSGIADSFRDLLDTYIPAVKEIILIDVPDAPDAIHDAQITRCMDYIVETWVERRSAEEFSQRSDNPYYQSGAFRLGDYWRPLRTELVE